MAQDWHVEARELHAQGMGPTAIARKLGKTEGGVRHILRSQIPITGRKNSTTGLNFVVYEPHRRRVPRRILVEPESLLAVSREYAAGHIDRETYLARITVTS